MEKVNKKLDIVWTVITVMAVSVSILLVFGLLFVAMFPEIIGHFFPPPSP